MLRAFSVFVMTTLVATLAWAATVSGPAPGVHAHFARRPAGVARVAEGQGRDGQLLGDVVRAVPPGDAALGGALSEYNSLGFELLAVNVEKNNADGARKWLEETPVTFPVLSDPNNEITKLYKVQTMPSTVLVARDGTMRFIHHGYKPGYENDYQTQVRALLRE